MPRFVFPPVLVLAAILALPLVAGGAAADESHDGKQIFLAAKCNVCHSVSTAGIEATTKSEALRGPDLVNVAAHHDAASLVPYLRKESEIEGKKHKKAFQGSDEELQALISWLLEQRSDG